MKFSTRRRSLSNASSLIVLTVAAAFLASCAAPQSNSMVRKTNRSKEYFAETEYGVKASPRVTNKRSRLDRGGGRDQVGKPYKVRGKWYYPKEDKNYRKVGAASWYGDAFHGRLTANGEIYDMTHLTAAHPTMPLPSYARVTNVNNGSSVIVRVNDRGPYANGRIIDLSKRAAEMLDYTHNGTAQVKVEYVGRAPLDGRDDQYLMASYRPGNRAPDPSDGLPEGVMVAMNGPTPSAPVAVSSFPGALSDAEPAVLEAESTAFAAQPGMIADSVSMDDPVLPAFGPIFPERPVDGFGVPQTRIALATMSYADDRIANASLALDAFQGKGGLSSGEIVSSWKRGAPQPNSLADDYVSVGTFETRDEADSVVKALAGFGRTALEKSELEGTVWYSVDLYSNGSHSLDEMLKAAWTHGAPDAMTVRD